MKWSSPRPYGISLTTGVKGPHARDGTWPASEEHKGVLTEEAVDVERRRLLREAMTDDRRLREERLADLRDGVQLSTWWTWQFCRCKHGHNGSVPPKQCKGWLLRDGMIRR